MLDGRTEAGAVGEGSLDALGTQRCYAASARVQPAWRDPPLGINPPQNGGTTELMMLGLSSNVAKRTDVPELPCQNGSLKQRVSTLARRESGGNLPFLEADGCVAIASCSPWTPSGIRNLRFFHNAEHGEWGSPTSASISADFESLILRPHRCRAHDTLTRS